jgi:hypothetical protein
MSRKERDRMTIMAGVREQELTRVAASELMAVSYRQSQRLWRRNQAAGDGGLAHRLRGKLRWRQLSARPLRVKAKLVKVRRVALPPATNPL